VTRYEIGFPANDHVFLKGHRIMVQVQSTWFPVIDRNPQRFVPNNGWDVKLYNTGSGIHAVRRPSPLGRRVGAPDRPIRVTEELRRLALEVGRLYGLDIYGVDVIGTERGWMVVDVNDFPSFGQIPGAPAVVAESILRIAGRAVAARPVSA